MISDLRPTQMAGLAVGVAALLIGLSAPFDCLSTPIQQVLGLAVFALIFWTIEPVPIELSSLWVLLLLPALGLLDFEQSFAPFATKTIWLIFAGMALSLGLTATGLSDSLASWTQNRLSTRPFLLLGQLHIAGLVAALLIPSGVVRVLLLMPLGSALADRMRNGQSGHVRAAILLSLLCSTYFGGCGLLTGAVPNLVLAGRFEQAQQMPIFWATWFYWMFPLIGLGRVLLSLVVIWLLYGRHLRSDDLAMTSAEQPSALTPEQMRALGILVVGILLWATDLVHHIQPAYIGLLLVVLFTLPRWGPLPFARLAEVRFSFLFYIAALFSLGTALNATRFDQLFIDAASQRIDLDALGWLQKHLVLSLMVLPLDFLMDIGAVAAVTTAPVMEFAALHNIPPLTAAFCVAMATTLAFLPYQSAPFMVAYGFRQFTLSQLISTQALISGISLIVICPLNVVYWRFVGLI